jgi:hypothetical protein
MQRTTLGAAAAAVALGVFNPITALEYQEMIS